MLGSRRTRIEVSTQLCPGSEVGTLTPPLWSPAHVPSVKLVLISPQIGEAEFFTKLLFTLLTPNKCYLPPSFLFCSLLQLKYNFENMPKIVVGFPGQ